jgi:hypothetical protein
LWQKCVQNTKWTQFNASKMWNFFSKDRIKLIFTTFSIPVLGQKCGKIVQKLA